LAVEPAQPATRSAQAALPDSWSERISIAGDFRYRYEEIDIEGLELRDRNRIRARAEIKARLPYDLVVGTGLASGGDDPVSSNQTLGGAGSRKDLHLNLAYVRWQPSEEFFLSAGKMKNNFYRPGKSGLLWDNDYNPEGLGAQWSNDLLFVTGAVNMLESDSNRRNQQVSWGVQAGLNGSLGPVSVTTGLGYFDVPIAGDETFFGDADNFYGNSFACADPQGLDGCVYLYDYEQLEWFVEMGMDVFDLPLKVYADGVKNRAVDDFDSGWLVGLSLGKAKQRGSWQIGYEYQDLEADAVFGLVSDSDFAGGGTDGKGHKLFGAYALHPKVQLSVTYFLNNETGENRRGDGLDYDRLMLDASFKY